ncbi:MAG: hypothetical protein AAF738_09155, partial [Bacteroidota bacterium]
MRPLYYTIILLALVVSRSSAEWSMLDSTGMLSRLHYVEDNAKVSMGVPRYEKLHSMDELDADPSWYTVHSVHKTYTSLSLDIPPKQTRTTTNTKSTSTCGANGLTLTGFFVDDLICGSNVEILGTGFVDDTYFQWSNGAAGTFEDIGETMFISESGFITVNATNPDGCQATFSGFVSVQDEFGVDVSYQPACMGQANGVIEIMATGSELIYDWDNDQYDGLSTVTGLAAGTYVVRVRGKDNAGASRGCTNTMVLTVPEEPVLLDISGSTGFCGNSVLTLETYGQFPEGTFFEWSNGISGYDRTTPNVQIASNIIANQSGLYEVTVTYPNGCQGVYTENITLNPNSAGLTVDVTDTCPGEQTGSIQINATPNTGGSVEYRWEDPSFGDVSMVSGLGVGEYEVLVVYFGPGGEICGAEGMTLR